MRDEITEERVFLDKRASLMEILLSDHADRLAESCSIDEPQERSFIGFNRSRSGRRVQERQFSKSLPGFNFSLRISIDLNHQLPLMQNEKAPSIITLFHKILTTVDST